MHEREPKLPPLLREGGMEQRKKDKSHRRKPKAHERKVADTLGGRIQPGSGAFDSHKGDALRAGGKFPILAECKRTSGHASLSVKAEWLGKITREALAKNRYPALSIQFDDEVMQAEAGGQVPGETTWIAFPESVVRALFEELGEEMPG